MISRIECYIKSVKIDWLSYFHYLEIDHKKEQTVILDLEKFKCVSPTDVSSVEPSGEGRSSVVKDISSTLSSLTSHRFATRTLFLPNTESRIVLKSFSINALLYPTDQSLVENLIHFQWPNSFQNKMQENYVKKN